MGKITIVGLGPGDASLITLGSWERLISPGPGGLLLRTAIHPTVKRLTEQGITFESFDAVYESGASFAQVYVTIAAAVMDRAAVGDVVYAVPGSPLVAEKTVELIRERAQEQQVLLEILPGMSFLEVMYTRLAVDPIHGLTVVDAADLDNLPGDLATALVVTQVYSRTVASDAKLTLMERYGDEYLVTVTRNLGLPEEELLTVPLYQLDRLPVIDHLTSVYVPAPVVRGQRFDLQPLVDVMARLRSPDGCVWDIEQTHTSLRRYIVEEVYEVLEAIDLADGKKLCEELGDLLLQIVFHARVAEESGEFSVQEVIDVVTEKMIRRHPHVFGDISVRDAAEVVVNWEAIKLQEKETIPASVLDGVPPGLPSLMRAFKLQAKAAKVGFDWHSIEPVWEKVAEELSELREAVAEREAGTADPRYDNVESELGDVLFAVVNLARFLGVEPETALNAGNNKFFRRFQDVEQQVANAG
ncbi:MAG TPA: nucleoside triphosphate pyrophosphohydrolase, partial [Patescibacteria group bacterium]|nr:nucleoside triphosphate pyrophosphohydrolase [Patescibacteria group bacterium]